ncbi:MAG: BrnT family toxin [Spirochaetes bacterium]|jgi:uncharacterized DUF497 family protein|nr:BrnT family toxin [Spirochaetota bacterium]
MEFDYDPAKSRANMGKHGIDFNEAQRLWDDPGLVILPARYSEEVRYLAIGMASGRHWTAIFTERGTTVRLISVRRSRHEEKALYERNQ